MRVAAGLSMQLSQSRAIGQYDVSDMAIQSYAILAFVFVLVLALSPCADAGPSSCEFLFGNQFEKNTEPSAMRGKDPSGVGISPPRPSELTAAIEKGDDFELVRVGREISDERAQHLRSLLLKMVPDSRSFPRRILVWRLETGEWFPVTRRSHAMELIFRAKPTVDFPNIEIPLSIRRRLEADYLIATHIASQKFGEARPKLSLAEIRLGEEFAEQRSLGDHFHRDSAVDLVLTDPVYGESTIGVAPDGTVFQPPQGTTVVGLSRFTHSAPGPTRGRILIKLAFAQRPWFTFSAQ